MPELRCKPGQMALIVRASRGEPCSALRVGVPVTVVRLHEARSLHDHFIEGMEGPMWALDEPLRCPHGNANCPGIDRMPDRCLRPFDPESKPEPVQADQPVNVDAPAPT